MPQTKPEPKTLAARLNHLVHITSPARGELSNEHVANAIREAGGPTISSTYIWQLRKGLRENPTKHHLEALSKFFGVPPAYFFDDDVAAAIDSELELLTAMRQEPVRQLAVAVRDLSPQSIAGIAAIVAQVRQLEGLDA